jgi:hypothetical protein
VIDDKPERLSMRVLVALCDILDCSPADLIEPCVETASPKKVAGEGKLIYFNPEFRPERARASQLPIVAIPVSANVPKAPGPAK